MNKRVRAKSRKTYYIEITDTDGYKHYPIEGADGIGKTTIERSDSPAMYRGYQLEYTDKATAEGVIPRIRLLAEAKGERSSMADKPILPVKVEVKSRGSR